ncbi:hypothetical protein [Parvibium lacunae]|uniref:Uncharacterized protein n=1 Tax=Parvibium lacunae TaxID=1888893 RepID=A0A368KZS8_9BURK|nr:hypothetical protein [Parvibium lacunae]RCS56521.1 hypothetical protein DU000_11160 [Parvibium lacunae]
MDRSIISVGKKKICPDNFVYEVIYEGEGENWENPFNGYEESPRPHKWLETFFLLDDGTRISLPVHAIPKRLPDRSGVVVVFSIDQQGQTTDALPADFPDVHAPHNAVIFNADGSLRCVINQRTKRGAYIQQTSTDVITHKSGRYGQVLSENYLEPIIKFGVLVGEYLNDSPDWFYELDPSTGDLIGTPTWKRY